MEVQNSDQMRSAGPAEVYRLLSDWLTVARIVGRRRGCLCDPLTARPGRAIRVSGSSACARCARTRCRFASVQFVTDPIVAEIRSHVADGRTRAFPPERPWLEHGARGRTRMAIRNGSKFCRSASTACVRRGFGR